MRMFLSNVANLIVRAWGLADELHSRVVYFVVWMIVVGFIALPINCFDMTRWINSVIGIVLAVLVAAIASSPTVALIIIGSGTVADPRNPLNNAGAVTKVWAKFVGTVVLYMSVFFLIAGTVPFARNWAVVPAIYLALIILFLVGPVWGMQNKWVQPLVYFYALLMLVVGFGSLISGATYVQWLGVDPYGYIGTTKVSEKLYEVQTLQQDKQSVADLKRLDEITKKISDGHPLDEANQEFLRGLSVQGSVVQKATSALGTLTSRAGDMIGSLNASSNVSATAASPAPASTPATAKKGESVTVSFNPGEKIFTGVMVSKDQWYEIASNTKIKIPCSEEKTGFREVTKPLKQKSMTFGTSQLIFYAGDQAGEVTVTLL